MPDECGIAKVLQPCNVRAFSLKSITHVVLQEDELSTNQLRGYGHEQDSDIVKVVSYVNTIPRVLFSFTLLQLGKQVHSTATIQLSASYCTSYLTCSAPLELVSSTVGGQVRIHRQQPQETGEPAVSGSSNCVQTWDEATAFQAAPNVACMVRGTGSQHACDICLWKASEPKFMIRLQPKLERHSKESKEKACLRGWGTRGY